MKVKNFQELKTLQNQALNPTEWITITQEMIDDFAKATLDFQWIHVDTERAKKESPFGCTIAHGLLSASLIPKFIEKSITLESFKMGFNYGMDRLRFPHPVLVNARLRAHVKIDKIEDYRDNGLKVIWDMNIEIENTEKPACVGKIISVIFE